MESRVKRGRWGRRYASPPGFDRAVVMAWLWACLLMAPDLGAATEAASPGGQGLKYTVQAVNVPLADLLHLLSERAGVPLVIYPRAQELINLTSQAEDLDTLVKGLLSAYNYVLHYHDLESGALSKIFVISRKTPAGEVQRGLAPELVVTVNAPALEQHPKPQKVPVSSAPGAPKAETPPVVNMRPRPPDPAKGLAPPARRPGGNDDGRFVKMTRAAAAAFGGVYTAPADQLEQAPLTLDNSHGFFQGDPASQQRSGLKLKALTPGSPLALLGLAAGDVVREINGLPVQSAPELTKQLGQTMGKGEGAAFVIGVERPTLPAQVGAGAEDTGATISPQHIYVQVVQ